MALVYAKKPGIIANYFQILAQFDFLWHLKHLLARTSFDYLSRFT